MREQANDLVKKLKITNIRRKYSGISEKIRVSFDDKEFTSRYKRVALKSLPNVISDGGRTGFGIDNVQIENFVKKSGDNISKNFLGVLPADEENRFNNVSIELKEKGAKYPFMVANTESADKDGRHWWSFLDIDGGDSQFFCSFGTEGLLGTIVENDWKIFNKVVGGMKNIFKKDNKITLLK